MADEWYRWLDSKPLPALIDGGLGHMLEERGSKLDYGTLWTAALLVTDPKELQNLAIEWLDAGADIITTATYQVTAHQLQDQFTLNPLEADRTIQSAAFLLYHSRQQFWDRLSIDQKRTRRFPKIAVSCGPCGAILQDTDEYSGLYPTTSVEQLRVFHLHRLRILEPIFRRHAPDSPFILCFETIGNTVEAGIIVNLMTTAQFCHIPYWISFQCRDAQRISSGDHISTAIKSTLTECGKPNLVAIGINCFDVNDVLHIQDIVKSAISDYMSSLTKSPWRVDTVCCPNSGEAWSKENGWYWKEGRRHDPQSWARLVCSANCQVMGGCCRIGPKYINALNEHRRGNLT